MTKYHFWKPLRKALSPAFTNKASLSFVPIFVKNFSKLNNDLEQFADTGHVVDVGKPIINTVLQIILESNFDHDKPDDRITSDALEMVEDNISERLFNPRYHPEWLYRLSKLYGPDKKLFTEIGKAFREIYQSRAKKLEQGHPPKHIFIDELLRFVKDYSDKQAEEILFDNAVTIFAAGYETAALTVAYAILLLGMYPSVDAKLQEELKMHYKEGGEINADLFKKLVYLDMVVKETLRLFPSAPISIRQAVEDTPIGE